jgi:hypothetical protein
MPYRAAEVLVWRLKFVVGDLSPIRCRTGFATPSETFYKRLENVFLVPTRRRSSLYTSSFWTRRPR